jgi:hypothetical protein
VRTDALIDMLAQGAGPAPQAVAARRLIPAVCLGLFMSGAIALLMIGPLPSAMFATPAPWIKLAYSLTLAVAAALLTARLSRPVARLAAPRHAVVAVLVAMGLVGAASMWATPAGERAAAVLGLTWFLCPWMVMAVALPALAATLWAVRGLAPTHLRGAGFAAGLLAGAVGATGYSLACPEASAAFVAVWYTAGIGLTALVGAAVGPRVLRW